MTRVVQGSARRGSANGVRTENAQRPRVTPGEYPWRLMSLLVVHAFWSGPPLSRCSAHSLSSPLLLRGGLPSWKRVC